MGNLSRAELIEALSLLSWLRLCAALEYFQGMRNVATLYATPDTPPPVPRPLFLSLVVAGFPLPADDDLDRDLDLHELLIQLVQRLSFFVGSDEEPTSLTPVGN